MLLLLQYFAKSQQCPNYYNLSVCYVPVLYENGLMHMSLFFFSPYGSPIILVLSTLNIFLNSDGVTPCGCAKYRWDIKISQFWTNNSLYLANDTTYRHSYYKVQIGTHMRSIKWCHFQ